MMRNKLNDRKKRFFNLQTKQASSINGPEAEKNCKNSISMAPLKYLTTRTGQEKVNW